MAGPVTSIRFARTRSLSWQTKVEKIINLVCSKRDGNSFQVATTLPIGGSYKGDGRPFLINLGDEEAWHEPAEMEATMASHERVFGFRPDSAVTISAMSKQNDDHRVLAELSATVAEQINGVIDVGGLIIPDYTVLPAIEASSASWSDIQDHVRAFTDTMPGRVATVPYVTPGGREWASHTVDPIFLRAWLVHPAFRMVK